MKIDQSRKMSFFEAGVNVIIGFLLGVLIQAALYPVLGLRVSMAMNGLISAVFTFASILRAYTLRRIFEAIRLRNEPLAPTGIDGRQAQRERLRVSEKGTE